MSGWVRSCVCPAQARCKSRNSGRAGRTAGPAASRRLGGTGAVVRSVTSLTRRESWSTAKGRTTATLAPVAEARRRPFLNTLARWAIP